MSRRSNRNNRNVIDQRNIERMVEAAIARKFTNPTGADVKPISQAILNQMQQQMAPQGKTQGMFSPGSPLRPTPGITPLQGPRQFQYPFGYNIGQLPRSTEITSFDTLRNLALLYDGIGICKRVWFDLCSKVELEIKPRPELVVDENGDPLDPKEVEAKYGARIEKWKAFFKKPDKKRTTKKWMRMALNDRLDIDAVSIFKHKDRAGRLYALEVIDGSTIKPLLDERGMEPVEPFPAYQQFVYGVPGDLILAKDLIYSREVERTNSPYGVSRVELIILRVNQALRKQNKDLATFTDGNIPAGTLEPPEDGSEWTPEQLLTYQTMWDGMLSGNEEIKARIKVIPPGAKFNKTDPDDIMTPFDQFLINVAVASFGLTMAELAFTETVNKSSGDTQEAVVYRRAMSPIMDEFGEMFTDVMAEEDGNDDLMACWKGYEEPEDFKSKVDAWNILTTNGTQSTSQAATALGLKPMVETEPFVLVQGQGPVFIKDIMDPKLRQAANTAKMAGYQQAANPPEQQPNEQGSQDKGGDDDQQAIANADKLFGGQQRFDPVHGYHGEFGDYSSGASKTSGGHHKGKHHKKSGKHRPHMSASQRMAHLAARFGKMKGGQQLSAIFSQIGAAITKGGQQQAIDGLLDKAWAAAKTLFADKPKSLAAMSRTLTSLDNRNDKGKLRAVEVEEEDGTFDELEDILDEQESQQEDQGSQSDMAGEPGQSNGTASQSETGDGDTSKANQADDTQATRGYDSHPATTELTADQTAEMKGYIFTKDYVFLPSHAQEQARLDLRRWRGRAIADMKAGHAFRPFVSEMIDAQIQQRVNAELSNADNVERVREIFGDALQDYSIPVPGVIMHRRQPKPQDAELMGAEPLLVFDPNYGVWEPSDTEQQLQAMRDKGWSEFTWHVHASHAGVCNTCEPNDLVTRAIGERFPSGHRLPQCHPGCQCTVDKAVSK